LSIDELEIDEAIKADKLLNKNKRHELSIVANNEKVKYIKLMAYI
jgi:hypothetical protein